MLGLLIKNLLLWDNKNIAIFIQINETVRVKYIYPQKKLKVHIIYYFFLI